MSNTSAPIRSSISRPISGPLTVRLFGEHNYDVDGTLYATPDAGRTYRFDNDGHVIKG